MILKKKTIKNQYENNGFVVVKNILTIDETNRLKKSLFDTIEQTKKSFKKRFVNFTKNNAINSLHGLDNFKCVKEIKNNKNIKELTKILLGNGFGEFGSELFAKPAKHGLPVPIHQDNKYWCLNNGNALTMWIALDKSTTKNGGIFYFKGSHKLGVFEHEPSFAPGSSQKIKYEDGLDHYKKILPQLNVGDCIIHHCHVAHGSNANKSNLPRTGLTLRFKAKNTEIKNDLKKSYEKDLKLQLKIRKKKTNKTK